MRLSPSLIIRRAFHPPFWLPYIEYLEAFWLSVVTSSAMPQMTPSKLAALEQETRAPALIGVMISGLVVSLVVLSLRFWARAKIVRKVGADDWASLLSFVSCL